MNKYILLDYIDRLKKEDILNYSYKQGITLSNNELNIIYDNIKNNTNNILDNPLKVINEIKDSLSINTYNKLIELYNKYKIFIQKR